MALKGVKGPVSQQRPLRETLRFPPSNKSVFAEDIEANVD